MKPHPRIRKTVKWGGAAATVLLLVVWVGSAWWWAGWASTTSGKWVTLLQGCFMVGEEVPVRYAASELGWGGGRVVNPWSLYRWHRVYWGCHLTVLGPQDWSLLIPLWIPAAACSLITAIAWRLDALTRRRARAGFCPGCDYDRKGLPPQVVCPECGAAAGASLE